LPPGHWLLSRPPINNQCPVPENNPRARFDASWYRLAGLHLFFALIALQVAGAWQMVMAQAPAPHAQDYHLTQYVHEVWGDENGLPQNSIFTTLQTHDCYLWLGTQEGLVRFDGTTFSHYAIQGGLTGNVVLSINEDVDGALWVGTEAGLSRLKDGSFTSYTMDEGLPGTTKSAELSSIRCHKATA
jgi:hypothetical protein